MSRQLGGSRAGRGLDTAPDSRTASTDAEHSIVDGDGAEPVTAPVPRNAPDPATTIRVGAVLRGRYRLTGLIGRGGMADVYRSVDQVLHRPVAVKVFRPGTDRNADRLRFLAEIRTLASLAHPNLVALYDGGQDEAQPWCVMQCLDGGTLADLDGIADGSVDPTVVATIGAQIADALGYIHDRGIVHRDVKPSNVLLDEDGDAYLSDFGVAQMVDATRMTTTGTLLGTAAYLSPEQVLGRSATAAVDVYALALVLLETLTGNREFPGAAVESAVARLSRAPRVPTRLGPAWAELLTAMTAIEPGDRPDAAAAASWLRSLARGMREEAAVPAQRTGRATDTAPTRAAATRTAAAPVGAFRPPAVTGALTALGAPAPGDEDGARPTSIVERLSRLVATSPARSAGLAAALTLAVIGVWQVPAALVGTDPIGRIGSSDVSGNDGELTDQGFSGGGLAEPSVPLASTAPSPVASPSAPAPVSELPYEGRAPAADARVQRTVTQASPSPSVTPSPSPTPSPSASVTPSPSPSATPTPTPSGSPTAVPVPSTTPSPSPTTTTPTPSKPASSSPGGSSVPLA